MALSKIDQVRFDGLQQTLNMLTGSGMPVAQIKLMMSPQIDEFQRSTNHKVRYIEDGQNIKFELLNLSRDFVRVRGVEDAKVLRAKINGVPVDVKITKGDEFSFSNDEIVETLRALADEVSNLSVEVRTLDITADVRKGSGSTDADTDVDTEHVSELTDDVE